MSQYTNPSVGWNVRAGQGVPAFPGSRIVPTRRVDPRDASMQRMLKFGSEMQPLGKLATLKVCCYKSVLTPLVD